MRDAYINCTVEGELDEAVLRKIFSECSLNVGEFHNKSLPKFFNRLKNYNQAALHVPWFALCDLDREECAPARVREYLPDPVPGMCFRIAVRSIEAWLLADREAMSSFLNVSPARILRSPEEYNNPKDALIVLARGSRNKDIRLALASDEKSSRKQTSEYTRTLSEFAKNEWSPRRARKHASSLERVWRSCQHFKSTGRWR